MTSVTGFEVTTGPGRTPLAHVSAPDATAWLTDHRAEVRAAVLRHGAVLLRGLDVGDVAGAAAAGRALLGPLLREREGFAPRDVLAEGVHGSAHWPPDQPMCMHHELSYAARPPGMLVLVCLDAPDGGGATALADARAVLRDLPADLVDGFAGGWQLVRGFSEFVGVPLEAAFGSADRAAVDRYCADNDVDARWTADGDLRTRQVRSAVRRHPVTGDACWFNQIAFLNEWTMAPEVREYLVAEFGPDGLPFTTRHADGSPVPESTVDTINAVYDRHTVREPWRRGDVMVVDNILMAHNREAYTGTREIVVAMGEPAC